LMAETPHLYAVIVVGGRPAPGCHPCPIGLLAELAHRGGILGGIPQDIAPCSGEGSHQPGRHCIVGGMGRGQFCGQGDADRADRHRQVPFPAVPPPMSSRFRPPRFRSNRWILDDQVFCSGRFMQVRGRGVDRPSSRRCVCAILPRWTARPATVLRWYVISPLTSGANHGSVPMISPLPP
jgi:hypothetical protein